MPIQYRSLDKINEHKLSKETITQNQIGIINTDPLINEVAIIAENSSNRPLIHSRKPSVAPSSIAISKQKLTRKTCKYLRDCHAADDNNNCWFTEQHGYGEIIKRLDRVEALHLASAKQGSQILVAVKKLCVAYTKYNDDNDEIKKLLPMKNPDQFDAMDTQLREDNVFAEKMVNFSKRYSFHFSSFTFGILGTLVLNQCNVLKTIFCNFF